MVRTAALLLLAGCDGVFGILRFPDASLGRSDGSAADAPAVSPCTGRTFDSAMTIPGFTAINAPTLADQLTMFYQRGSVPPTIWRASRANLGAPFVDEGQMLVSPPSQLDPALTADGATMVFASDSSGTLYVWQATLDAEHVWGNAAQIPGLGAVTSVDVSADGNTIYYVDTAQFLYGWDRATNAATKMTSQMIAGPSVSADGLELFWTGSGGVWYAQRGSTSEPFPAGALMFPGEGDPDLSPDGMLLITNMKLHHRSCF